MSYSKVENEDKGGGDEVVKQADDMVLQVDEVDEGGFALDSVHRAEYVVKIMAILQNPSKISEILTAENFQSGLKDHYGTDDPQKVAEMIFHDLQDAIKNGTWSIGRLAFFGGCYGTVAGGLNMLPPASIFRVFTPLAGLNMLFLLLFGVVIMTVESDGDTISSSLKANIIKYCALMETIWGRGLFYMYVGATQILGPTEHLFGWYMFAVGVVYLVLHRMTQKHIESMGEIFRDDTKLEASFAEHAGEDGVLNRAEFAMLTKDVGLELSHAELEMMLKKLDPDHDGYISLSELKIVFHNHEESSLSTYVIGPVARLDPNRDTFKLSATKNKSLGIATPKGLGAAGELDWSKVKKLS